MIEVERFLVRSLDLGSNELSWRLKATHEDPLDYSFHVLRSESPEGPFDDLTPAGFSDRYLFIDNAIPTNYRWRTLYYKIRVIELRTSRTEDSAPVTREPEEDLITREIRSHLQLLHQEHVGRRCWLLPVRTFGQRCACFDVQLGHRIRSSCITCFDTGWVRGYLDPIEVFMDIDPSPKVDQVSDVAALQPSYTTAKLGYYPPAKPGDLIIEPENRRWRVIKQTQTEHVRARVQQQFELFELLEGYIEFQVPLKLGAALRDIFLSPRRNFTNPHSIDLAVESNPFEDT